MSLIHRLCGYFKQESLPSEPIEIPSGKLVERLSDGIHRNLEHHNSVLQECLDAVPNRAADIKLWTEQPIEAQELGVDLNTLISGIENNGSELIADEFNCLLMSQYEIQFHGGQPIQFFKDDDTSLVCENVAEIRYEELDC